MRRRQVITGALISLFGFIASSVLHAASEAWGSELSYLSGWEPLTGRNWQYKPHFMGKA